LLLDAEGWCMMFDFPVDTLRTLDLPGDILLGILLKDA
jgi:hypothetical protein